MQKWHNSISTYIDGLMQKWHNSSANALELRLFSIKPSISCQHIGYNITLFPSVSFTDIKSTRQKHNIIACPPTMQFYGIIL